ncbi:MAG TPA: hypothetical protein VHN13_10660 [Candidatus Tectomicrobia bacterium]|nr:hypothetical protein [Candidatus Tectomicrobia bacterium]
MRRDLLLEGFDLRQHGGILFIGFDLEELALRFLEVGLLLDDARFCLATLFVQSFDVFAVFCGGGAPIVEGTYKRVKLMGFGGDGLFEPSNRKLQVLELH